MKLLLARLQRLEVQHAARTDSDDSRAKVAAAREQVDRILAAFPPPDPLPRASVAVRLAAAIATWPELRASFERLSARGDRVAVVMLAQSDRWISDNAGQMHLPGR